MAGAGVPDLDDTMAETGPGIPDEAVTPGELGPTDLSLAAAERAAAKLREDGWVGEGAEGAEAETQAHPS